MIMTKDTMVFTKNGYVEISSLKIGDEIFHYPSFKFAHVIDIIPKDKNASSN